jgi:ABC-2 type transport system ATP-binding protein
MSVSFLHLENVTKRFGDFTAADALSFAVPEGCVFGFLGGNGAGKTMSLRMALDIIRPTSARIEILDGPPSRENAVGIGPTCCCWGECSGPTCSTPAAPPAREDSPC